MKVIDLRVLEKTSKKGNKYKAQRVQQHANGKHFFAAEFAHKVARNRHCQHLPYWYFLF